MVNCCKNPNNKAKKKRYKENYWTCGFETKYNYDSFKCLKRCLLPLINFLLDVIKMRRRNIREKVGYFKKLRTYYLYVSTIVNLLKGVSEQNCKNVTNAFFLISTALLGFLIYFLPLNTYVYPISTGIFLHPICTGRGGQICPLSKNCLIGDRSKIFCLLKLLSAKFFKIK